MSLNVGKQQFMAKCGGCLEYIWALSPVTEKYTKADRQVDRWTQIYTISNQGWQKTLQQGHFDLVAFSPIYQRAKRSPGIAKAREILGLKVRYINC